MDLTNSPFLSFCTLHDIVSLLCTSQRCLKFASSCNELSLLKLSDLFIVDAVKIKDVPYKSNDKNNSESNRYHGNTDNPNKSPLTIPKYLIKASKFKGISQLKNMKITKFVMDFDDTFIANKTLASISDLEFELDQTRSVSLISANWLFLNILYIQQYVILDGNEYELTFWNPPDFRYFLQKCLIPTNKQCKIQQIDIIGKKVQSYFWSQRITNLEFDMSCVRSIVIGYLQLNHWSLKYLTNFRNLEQFIVNDYATDQDKNYLWCQFDPEGYLSYINHYFAPFKRNRNGVIKWINDKLALLTQLKQIIWKGSILQNVDELCDKFMIIVDCMNQNQSFRNKYDSD